MNVIYLCPATPYGKCDWEGCAGDILNHFEISHRDLLIQTNTVRLGISKEYEQNILMYYLGDVYLIQIKFTCNRLELRLRFLGEEDRAAQIKYYVEVLAGVDVFSSKDALENYMPVRNNAGAIEIDVDVLKCTTKLLSEIVCCINFEGKVLTRKASLLSNTFPLKQVCPKKAFFNESKDIGEIYYPKMFHSNESLLDDNTDAKSEPDSVDACKVPDSKHDDYKYVMCATCGKIVIFPIFLCEKTHGVCYTCHDRLCGKCDSFITNTRDFHMEKHSKNLSYQCKYASKGCKVYCKGSDIYQHQAQCFYHIHTCPVCGLWNGKYNEIDSHFRIVHPSIKLVVNKLQTEFSVNARFLIKDTYGFFYCTSLMENGVIEWTVQFHGPKEICFICEIVLQGKTENKVYTLYRNRNEYTYTVAVNEIKLLKLKRPFLKITDFNTYRQSDG